MPRSAEDVRGRLLTQVEGHPIAEAREFLSRHGFRCDEPLPSATDARVHLCHPVAPPRPWTAELYERNGRASDIQAR